MTGWTAMHEHKPTEADCDDWGCVLAWHVYSGVIVVHMHNIENYGLYITHWMPTPAAPMG